MPRSALLYNPIVRGRRGKDRYIRNLTSSGLHTQAFCVEDAMINRDYFPGGSRLRFALILGLAALDQLPNLRAAFWQGDELALVAITAGLALAYLIHQ
jgi:hypothetical protein